MLVVETVFASIIETMRLMVNTLGPLGLFSAMVIQAVIAPIPSDLLVVSSVALGIDRVAVVVAASAGSTVGGVVAFYISRKGGKKLAFKLGGGRVLGRFERWFERYGDYFLVFGRAAPFMSSDAISYAAGFTAITVQRFVILSFVGAVLRVMILVAIG
ncbi:MAG: TVP38/TMEM64 family protein, partial [Thaumarchaeota archaeon]|nr:TVP38/TMEM64 family protein [Nitrososphaerota archaeon]